MLFKNHPRGLVQAALANMGERFGYYIMNAVLVLFLCSKFGLNEETSSVIYSVFYFGIYFLSLVGGIIADRKQNYNGTIAWGLVVMSLGYVILAIPILSTKDNIYWLLPLTCFALLMIAFGNGLFKGNLQAIVGQMYDNFEKEAAKKGPEALKIAKSRRDTGFQIFYVFINIGGLIAPFVAPLLREWWLKAHNWAYNADLPALCHQYIEQGTSMASEQLANLNQLVTQVSGAVPADMGAFCSQYLDVFNTGVHYSFIASVVAMLISLTIFLASKRIFPTPDKKAKADVVGYTPEEKAAMAKEIKQRLYALFAVLGIAIFFWFSFHQNGQSLSYFARDFVVTSSIAPEIWQALNPFFVIVLTPIITIFFSFFVKRGKEISTPRKIAIGMAIAGCAYLFLAIFSMIHRCHGKGGMESRAVDSRCHLLLPDSCRVIHITAWAFVCLQGRPQASAGIVPGLVAHGNSHRQPVLVAWTVDVQQVPHLAVLDGLLCCLLHLDGRHARHGQVAGACDQVTRHAPSGV